MVYHGYAMSVYSPHEKIGVMTPVQLFLGSRNQLRNWPGKVLMQLARAAPGSLGC